MRIIKPPTIVTIEVIYYRPDYNSILQSFLWQTQDVVPELIRVHRFLTFWKKELQVPIQQILVSHGGTTDWRNIEDYQRL